MDIEWRKFIANNIINASFRFLAMKIFAFIFTSSIIAYAICATLEIQGNDVSLLNILVEQISYIVKQEICCVFQKIW